MATFDLEIDGIEWWVPIPLDVAVKDREDDLAIRFPDLTPPGRQYLASVVERHLDLGNHADSAKGIGLWARTRPGQPVPDLTASLTLMSFANEVTIATFADDTYSRLDHVRPLTQEVVDTASGHATLLEALFVAPSSSGDGDLVAQLSVVWIRDDGDVLVLSASTTDLALAAEIKSELVQLASGVHGFL